MKEYNKTPQALAQELGSDLERGLDQQTVAAHRAQYGENKLQEEEKRSLLAKVKDQLLDPMILILFAASLVSALIGSWVDALVILAIVLINAGLSVVQEGKAEEALAALQKMASPTATVIRQGQTLEIASEDLVPGDLVLLEMGDIVPADLRLVQSANLKIDESSLTGESVPVDKEASVLYEGAMEIGDRENMAYSSTIVSYGRAQGLVTSIGRSTEIGHIASSLENVEQEMTPLQRKLAQLSKVLGILVVAICALVFVIGFFIYQNEPFEMFMTAISLAVAAIPEGLPAIVTIVLSLGMSTMADHHAIVKRLLAVETLGTTTVICSDKTGTLTQNEMTVQKIYLDDQEIEISGKGYEPVGDYLLEGRVVQVDDAPSLYTFLHIASLANDAKLIVEDGQYGIVGDPTEASLMTLAEKLKITRESANASYPRIAEIPFDSDRKMMTTFHENFIDQKIVSFTKGAPDLLLERCRKILKDGKVVDLTEDMKKKILDKNSEFSRQSLRVLALAFQIHDQLPTDLAGAEDQLIFVGLAGMIDPARDEARLAIQECKKAGIRPVMITGDYLETAFAIGQTLGIAQSMDEVILGRDLNDKTEEQLQEIVQTKNIYARVSPENKVQIVRALRAQDEIVAMTGDGVNDAPAIKQADIGVAMGITGTDVTKNAADLILTDDNFATIVNAVKEGRVIYANIKKFVSFLLSCNVGEILVVLVAILLDWPTPFIPIQLLWLNLVTDSFPALALGVEPGDPDIMSQPPRDPKESIIDPETRWAIVFQSLAIAASTLFAFNYGMNHFDGHLNSARTVAFATLIMAELLRSYSVRSTHLSVFQIGLFSNKKLVLGTSLSFVLMLAVIYIPGINDLFDNIPLHLEHWAVILPASLLPFLVGELTKYLRYGRKHQE